MATGSSGEPFSNTEWRHMMAHSDLSKRQSEIAWCLMHGRSDRQITQELGISMGTLRTHMQRMFEKADCQDRVEFILSIFRQFRQGCRELDCPRRRRQSDS